MKNTYDIIIVGFGPAGVSASLYTQRAGMDTLLIGSRSKSLEKADSVENYYGLAPSLSGKELYENGILQAENVGATLCEDQVVGISWEGDYRVKTTQNEYLAKAVIIATGTKRSAPPIKGLKELEGRGVSYCAVCDGFFYRKKAVGVLGSGDYAHEEAKELMAVTGEVTIFSNGEPLEKREGFLYNENKILGVNGEEKVESLSLEGGDTVPLSGLFVAIGTAGATDLAKKLGVEISGNSIKVDENM
ncbi:MAG: NAD(P)/FAD-dependent oxidoreductase, partial [Oscillospiraceae bacterium]